MEREGNDETHTHTNRKREREREATSQTTGVSKSAPPFHLVPRDRWQRRNLRHSCLIRPPHTHYRQPPPQPTETRNKQHKNCIRKRKLLKKNDQLSLGSSTAPVSTRREHRLRRYRRKRTEARFFFLEKQLGLR